MPVHDWTRVDSGIFHHFHLAWTNEIARELNGGLLPDGYYAMSEQRAEGPIPDVLTLQRPEEEADFGRGEPETNGGLAVATAPPKVSIHSRMADAEVYARRARSIVVRHRSGHRIVAVIEIVSPGNKDGQQKLDEFAKKAQEFLNKGVHLLVMDVHPPTPRDPQGIHPMIWNAFNREYFELPADQPFTFASYVAGEMPEAYVQPAGFGEPLPEMPVFLTTERYVPVPLDGTYNRAFDAVPEVWRRQLV